MEYIGFSLILSPLLRSTYLSCCELKYSVDVCKCFSCTYSVYAELLCVCAA